MAGHNKWAQIKHKKAVTDAKKSREYGKLARLISMETQRASGDTTAPSVRKAIERARAVNMSSDNIDRAVKKGAAHDGAVMEEALYEAYGPGGAAILITVLTDNKNRTVAEIKHLISLSGGTFAGQGACLWAFTKTDEGYVPNDELSLGDDDKAKLVALLEKIDENDDVQDVSTNANIK